MKLSDALADFLLDGKARALSPKTLRAYNYNLERFIAYLERAGVRTLDDLLPTHIRGFLAGLQDRALSPYTIDQFYRSIKVFLRWCVRQDYLQKDPLRGISRPQRPQRFVPRLSMEQVQELLHILAEGEYFPERNLAMVALLVDSGLRSSELLNLDLADAQVGLLRIVGKGNKERWVPLGEYTQRAVEDYLRVRGDHPDCPALFVSRRGTRLGTQGIRLILCKLREQMGIQRLYPHLLRHTFANLYLCSEGDLRSLQLILGHADIQTTAMIYTAPNTRDLQAKHRLHSPLSQIA